MNKKKMFYFVGMLICFVCFCSAFIVSAQGYNEEIYIDCDRDGYTDTELEAEFDTDNGTVSVSIVRSECEKVVIPPVLSFDDEWDDWYDWDYNYEDETDEKLQRFVSVLEPTLIIILSFFIGLILVSFLLPLLGIMSSIG